MGTGNVGLSAFSTDGATQAVAADLETVKRY